jgi:hypothetical protein
MYLPGYLSNRLRPCFHTSTTPSPARVFREQGKKTRQKSATHPRYTTFHASPRIPSLQYASVNPLPPTTPNPTKETDVFLSRHHQRLAHNQKTCYYSENAYCVNIGWSNSQANRTLLPPRPKNRRLERLAGHARPSRPPLSRAWMASQNVRSLRGQQRQLMHALRVNRAWRDSQDVLCSKG